MIVGTSEGGGTGVAEERGMGVRVGKVSPVDWAATIRVDHLGETSNPVVSNRRMIKKTELYFESFSFANESISLVKEISFL